MYCKQLPFKLLEFFQYTKEMTDARNFELRSIGNMDETPLWFDLPCSKSYDFRGVKPMQARTTGKEKIRYTVVLSAMADGTKLPCMVIFKGLKNVPKGRFPNGVTVQVNQKGFMTAELLNKWKECVCKTRPGGFFRPSSLIVFDSATSHLKRTTISSFKQHYNTEVAIIPGGMAPLLQPVDVHWNKPFKSAMRDKCCRGLAREKKNTQLVARGKVLPMK
jgi:hypothetical protein